MHLWIIGIGLPWFLKYMKTISILLPLNNDTHVHQVFCSHSFFVLFFSKFNIRLLLNLIKHYPENLNLTTTPNHLYLICFSFLQNLHVMHKYQTYKCFNYCQFFIWQVFVFVFFFVLSILYSVLKNQQYLKGDTYEVWINKLTAEVSSNRWMNELVRNSCYYSRLIKLSQDIAINLWWIYHIKILMMSIFLNLNHVIVLYYMFLAVWYFKLHCQIEKISLE